MNSGRILSNTFAVQELKGWGHISYYHSGLTLGETFPPLNMVKELTSSNLLEHQVESLRLLEVLDQLDDISVALHNRLN